MNKNPAPLTPPVHLTSAAWLLTQCGRRLTKHEPATTVWREVTCKKCLTYRKKKA